MKRLMFWIGWLMIAASAVAQVPMTEWTQTYGGNSNEVGYCVQPLSDGGFVIGGITDSFGSGGLDMWFLRIASNGDSLWSNTFGGSNNDFCYGIATLPDGFLLAGVTSSFGAGGEDMWIIRTDEVGDSLWSRTYGGSGNDRCNAILPTADSGFLLGGGGVHHGREAGDINVIKVNATGDSLWSLVLGGTVNALAPTSDGNYVAAGYWGSAWPGDAYFWLA